MSYMTQCRYYINEACGGGVYTEPATIYSVMPSFLPTPTTVLTADKNDTTPYLLCSVVG